MIATRSGFSLTGFVPVAHATVVRIGKATVDAAIFWRNSRRVFMLMMDLCFQDIILLEK
jgi:hypothetical protein